MKTLVMYGETFGATKMVPVTSTYGHIVTSFGVIVIKGVFDLMDELIAAGVTSKQKFSADPRPVDKNVPSNLLQDIVFKVMYGPQKRYEEQLKKIGLLRDDAFTCACSDDMCGVNIVFNGRVILGTRARKTRSKSYAAFSSINYPYIATLQDGVLMQYIKPEGLEKPQFCTELNTNVGLIKMIPGIDFELFEFLAERKDAVIIESFGVGGLPSYGDDKFLDIVINAIGREAEKKYDVRWLPSEFKKREGNHRSIILSEKYGLDVQLDKLITEISVGEQQRTEILKALYRGVDILILDEPLSGVDVEGMSLLMDMLDEIRKKFDLSILMTTHDFTMLEQYCDQVVLLQGKILRRGTPLDVLNSEEFAQAFHMGGGAQA